MQVYIVCQYIAGMLTMGEDGIFKAAQGITTIEEVLRVVTE